MVTLRRHFLPSPSDHDDEADRGDSSMNLARALWLAEYFHESNINSIAEGITFAFSGSRT
ncbi:MULTISPECIES: DUF6890 family protein [Klebsiella]|uniref:DUF6890 family protein n=1 Tax=Klebsiella TaxID=570 RepID=UPI00094999AA|nr:hypothetical protein [Klebsiella sp. CVUAS 5466.2]MBZ7719576.1 hypothetical protein [Klebsiella oxytoca]MBZ7745295.1 hypothetical protein [Klebsiella variicola]